MSAPPRSLDPIRHRLGRRRSSIQPSERAHQGFYKEISNPYNEAGIAAVMIFDIMGDCGRDDRNYGSHLRRAITETPRQDFRGLSIPFPDVLEGLRTRALPNHLHHHALHKEHSLSFCHFAAEFTYDNLH
jgi:hypothetical protein